MIVCYGLMKAEFQLIDDNRNTTREKHKSPSYQGVVGIDDQHGAVFCVVAIVTG